MVAPAQNFQPGASMMGGDGAEGQDDDAGSQEICITVASDGSLSVGLEMGGEMQGDETPAKDIADALKQALMLYKQISGGAQAQDQAAFDGGFGKSTSITPSASAPTERNMA